MKNKINFIKLIVSIFISILIFNNFATIMVYASSEEIEESQIIKEIIQDIPEENNEKIVESQEETIEKEENKDTEIEEKVEEQVQNEKELHTEEKIIEKNIIEKEAEIENKEKDVIKDVNTVQSYNQRASEMPYIYPNNKPSDFSQNKTMIGKNSYAGQITKIVGDEGYHISMPIEGYNCNSCGKVLVEYIPDYYCDISLKGTDEKGNDVKIDDIKFIKTQYPDSSYAGYPAMKSCFKIVQPGKHQYKLEYYANFCIDSERINGYCNYCGKYISTTITNYTWYKYRYTFDVTAKAYYNLKYDTSVSGNESSYISNMPENEVKILADTSTIFDVSKKTPQREGYIFKGWTDIKDSAEVKYKKDDKVTIDWQEGFGSESNPVTKTLYAVWEEENSATNKTTYEIIREYYINNEKIATVTLTNKNGEVGQYIIADKLAEENPKWKVRTVEGEKLTFNYVEDKNNNINLVEDSDMNIITLRYEIIEEIEIEDPDIPLDPSPVANYKVEWYDINGNKLKDTEERYDRIGNIVSAEKEDKVIENYIFVEDYEKNNLEAELDAEGNVILKLYFKKTEQTLPEDIKEIDDKKEIKKEVNNDIPENKKVYKTKEVNTGDNSKTEIYKMLVIISLIGIITVLFIMSKNKSKKIIKIIILAIIFSSILSIKKNMDIVNKKDVKQISYINNKTYMKNVLGDKLYENKILYIVLLIFIIILMISSVLLIKDLSKSKKEKKPIQKYRK